MPDRQPNKRSHWSWRSQAFRGLVYQVVAVVLLGSGIWYLASNTLANMAARGIQSGFGFLTGSAGFDIGETVLPYDALDPYWMAFLAGVLNTLRVAIVGIVCATVLGTVLGIGRFSHNALVRGLCYCYVEVFRNVPVLLQLILWYLLFAEALPPVNDALSVFGTFWLSKGGLSFPVPVWGLGQALAGVGLLLGIIVAIFYLRWAQAEFERTGTPRSMVLAPLAMMIATAIIGWLIGGAPTSWNVPKPGVFSMEGGASATPEFMAVLLGLVFYTSAFIAEVVRAGIQSVSRGQTEAASSIGLNKAQSMRLVVLPQALRVIIPPITSQYLNLTKNSSLAVAIGYPDVVSIANTALNQTGRAVECIAIVMLVYLTTSLSTSAFMNWYNARAAIRER